MTQALTPTPKTLTNVRLLVSYILAVELVVSFKLFIHQPPPVFLDVLLELNYILASRDM
jgi:hypothetical protein